MKLVDELVPLRLYKSKKKFYMPFSPNNKKTGSAIFLMGQNQEESEKMMNLPYLYNPNHMFRAYYIGRNAMNYIDSSLVNDDNDYDDISEAAISEAMWHRTDSKFNIDNGSTMDERIIKKVYNGDTIKYILKRTNIKDAPDSINVIVYPSIAAMKRDMPESLKDSGKDVYSYTTGNTIHILSYLVYDPKNMDGPYEMYLLNELIFCIIMNTYPEINSNIAMCVAMAISGQVDWWIEEKKKKGEIPYFLMAQYINEIYKEKGPLGVHKILNGNFSDIQASIGHKAVKLIKQYYKKPLFEGKLETKERNKLDDNKFGIPSKRKYPMPDAAHVKAAIKMFNHCDKEDEAELARNIKKFAKEYGVELNPGPDNRLSNHVKGSSKKNESAILTEDAIDYLWDGTPIIGNHDPKYLDILRILQDFTKEEFDRVSFNPTYKESPWIEKRIVEYDVNGQPMSFLDVYHFPVNPDVAYITCGVHPMYRGHHLAQIMLQKLIDSGYHIENNIKKYIWHVHAGNEASEKTAIHANFKKPSDKLDKYGRMAYELSFSTEEDNDKPAIPYKESSIDDEYDTSYKEGVYILDESSMMLIDEAEKKFDQRFKKFLYKERIRNTQTIMKIYADIKQRNPVIDRTYRSLDKYKNLNLFVDTFYYHELYLKHTTKGTKKTMEMYWDFLMRLMNNDDIDEQYIRKTYFFPVMKSRFVQSADDLLDWKKNLNLFSCIEYFSKKNPRLLDALNGRTIMCLGDNGYFKIEGILEWNPAIRSRLKRNLNRILTGGEIAIDDEDEEGDIPDENAGAANMVMDTIEDRTNIQINDVRDTINNNHLRLNPSSPDIFDKDSEDTIAFMMLAQDSKQSIDLMNNLQISHLKDIRCYYKPKK